MTPLQQVGFLATLAAAVAAAPLAGPIAAPVAVATRIAAATPASRLVKLTPDLRSKIARNAALARRIHIPYAYRQRNWMGRDCTGGWSGSCAWASLANLLHWQGHHAQAEWIRNNFGAGAGPQNLYPTLDRAKIPYAACGQEFGTAGDVGFLEWCCRTRRGACVPVGAWCRKCGRRHPCEHMLNLVGIDATHVLLLDNNGGDVYARDRNDFIRDWYESGGWAFTPVLSPAPPLPWTIEEKP
jgi:hypothetical protein